MQMAAKPLIKAEVAMAEKKMDMSLGTNSMHFVSIDIVFSFW